MDFDAMKRRDLQALCKKHNLVASGTNSDLVSRLASALKKEEMEEKPVTRHAKKRRVSVGEESVKSVDLGKGSDGKKSEPIPNEAKKKPLASPRVGKDVPAPSRATRSRGGAGEVVDVHSFPDERKKRMGGRGGEAKIDGGDDGSKEMPVRATRSRGGGEEAIVPPNVEKTRSKKDGSTKNDNQVKNATPVRTTRSKGGLEVTDIKHSSPIEKKTAKGKGLITENDDGVKKESSVRTTRSRVGADAVSSHASPSVEKKSKKRGRVSSKNDEGVDAELSVRTTRSRQGAEEAVSHSSPPVEKKSTKRGNMSIKDDDGAKEIPARTTRSRVSAEVPVNRPPSPVIKNKPTSGKVSAEGNGVNKEMSVRTTRSRIGEVAPSINRLSSAEKNKAKIGGVNAKNNGVKEIPVRTTRSRLGTEMGILPSPLVAKKKRGRGEMKTEQTKIQKAVQVTRSLRGKEIEGVVVSAEKSDTRPGKRRKVIDDDPKEEEVKEAAVLKKSTRQTRPKKMGKEKNGRKGKSILKLKEKTPKQVKRKAITSDRSVTLDRNKESSVKKKVVTPDPGSAPKPEKTPKQSKSSVKKKVVTPDPGSAPKPEKTPKQSKSSVKKKLVTPDPGNAPKPEKTPKQSKRLVEQPPTKATRAGVSNSKHKEPASTLNTVAATGEMQTDEKSKKTQVQKQVRKSIKSVGKSYDTQEKLPQSSTRSGPGRKSRNVDAESSVHEMQGSDDVPSFVTGNGSTQKVNETAGIVKAVAESISFVDDGASVGVRVVEGGLINSIDEATQLTIDLAGKPYHPVMEPETQSVEAVFEESITMGVGGMSRECITSAKNVEASEKGSVKGCTLSMLDETKHDHLEPSGVDQSKFEVDDVPYEEDTATLPSVGGTSRECITGGVKNVEASDKGSVKGCTVSLLDETKHDHLDPSGVNQSKFEEVVDDAPNEEVTETLPDVGGTVEEAFACQQINELDTAAQNINNMEGEINHTAAEYEKQNEGTTPTFDDFPRHMASETTLEGISSASKDVGKSVHDFVENHVLSLGDDVMYKAQGGVDDHIETSGPRHANFEESLGVAPIKDFSETPIDMGGGELVRETTACLENNDLDTAPQKTIDVAEEINEVGMASQRTIDVEGADSCIKIDGSTLDDETFTGQQITESDSAWKDIDIAGEINLPVMEPGTQSEEVSPIFEEAPSIGGTIDVAEETNELDTAQRTIDEAGADDNIEMDCGTLVDEASTGQEITELAIQDIDVAGEIHLPVLELKTQNEEASPLSVESPTDCGTFDVAEETNDLDTSSQKSIGVEEGDNHLRLDATPDIDVAGEINCHVMELKTHNEEALPVSEECPTQSIGGTIDVAEDINELDVASGLEDHMKMGSGMSIEETSTGEQIPGLDTTILDIDVTGEIDRPAMELKTHNEEASPISEESPIQCTVGTSPEDITVKTHNEEASPISEESPIQCTVGTSPEDITSGTKDVNESEKVSVEDHTLSLSRGQVDAHADSSTDDRAKFGNLVCGSSTKEVSGTPEIAVDRIVEETSTREEIIDFGTAIQKTVDMTGDVHVSAVKHEMHKEEALPISEEITMLSSVGTSAECIIGVNKDVDDDQKVLVGVSSAKDFSETYLEITGEKSVEDTSSSEQLNELGQADPVLDVGHLSTADSLQSHLRSVKDTSIADCITSDFGVEHGEYASMAFQRSSALSQGKGAIDFDDASAVEHVSETIMLQESPEGSGGFNTAADTASNVELGFDKVGEASIVKSREVLQEKKHDCNSDKLKMEFGVEHVKEDASMMLQELPESSHAKAELSFEDIGKDTSMFQETPDASLADAELHVEDFGEASVAKSGKVSEENAQNKLSVPSEIDAINETFKLLIEQFGDEHPGLRVSQGTPELGVEDVSQEVFEENIELSKEVNLGSDSDDPNAKVSWDVDENNETAEVSVEEFDHSPTDVGENDETAEVSEEEFDHTPGDVGENNETAEVSEEEFDHTPGHGAGDLDSRKGEMHTDEDFDYEFGELSIINEENRAPAINAFEEEKPSEGASEMFVNFNEDADLRPHPRVGAISPFYTLGNEDDEGNFGFIPRDSWHVDDQYDDLKNFGISETQSHHVEYSQSHHVEYSQRPQESADPKISGLNYIEGKSAEESLQEEHHDQKKESEHFAEARKSSPWSSRREQ